MRLLILLFLLLLNQAVFSQHFTASVSEKMDYKGHLELIKVGDYFYSMSVDENSQMAFTAKLYKARHSIKLLKYDKDLKLVKENKLADGKKEFGPFYSELKEFNGRLHLFYYKVADGDEGLKIFQTEIDQNTLNMMDQKKIIEVEQKNFGFGKAMFGTFNYKLFIKFSPDKSKAVALWSSDQINRISYCIFESTMNVLKMANNEIAGIEKLQANEVCIDNSGNLFFVYNKSNLYVNKLNGGEKKITFKPGGSEVHQLFISPSSRNDQLYITGVLSETDDKTKAVFSQTLNISSLILSEVQRTLIPQDIKDKLSEQLYIYLDKPKKFYMDPLEFRSVIGEDGQIDLFAYSTKTITISTYNGKTHGYRTQVYWGSYLYVQIKSGKAVFIRIPRASHTFGGCTIVKNNNKTYIFYSDDEKNANSDLYAKVYEKKVKMIYMGAYIDEEGRLSRETINVPTDGELRGDVITESPTSFLFPGVVGKKNNFFWMKLTLQ